VRIVLDTNVLVSGVLNPHGSPGRCLDLILDGDLTPLFDDRILAESRDVLLRPRFGFDPREVGLLVDYFIAEGEALGAPPLDITLPDPDDLAFLEVAIAGNADALVTGNLRHFPREAVSGRVEILAPSQLLQRLAT
jgi:putative PIN family toxin of toxin-antitoxin system